MEIQIQVPLNIADKVEVRLYQRVNMRGDVSAYCADMQFEEKGLFKTATSREMGVLRGKVEGILKTWENLAKKDAERQHKESRAEEAEELNARAENAIEGLNNILAHTLDVDDKIDWNSMKRSDTFEPNPKDLVDSPADQEVVNFNKAGKPTSFIKAQLPPEKSKPTMKQAEQKHNFFFNIFFKAQVKAYFEDELAKWERESLADKKRYEEENASREKIYEGALAKYNAKQAAFDSEKEQHNELVEKFKERYNQKESKAIEEYCDLVLSNSEYPDYFPQSWQIEYKEESKILVVEYDLPSPDKIPSAESYKYVKSQDKIVEKKMTAAASKKLYDSIIYQICIRTIHELLEADVMDVVNSIVFNGVVVNVNSATGNEEVKVIMSVHADKKEFMGFNLSSIDPKATFKHMKGISAASLVDLIPVPPTIAIEKTDKRFIEGREVVGNLSSTVNLAAMHWEEFEHLVRELFEKEFSAGGGEVKITQSSSDGGVDAIAFDPDPIKGGKMVIQAKRYTNLVGISAVRDLYGTVMNEGAIKGILVTTSDYGRDSYEFIKDKPLTLMNGNNLLALLEKHGHKASINIKEAKKILSE